MDKLDLGVFNVEPFICSQCAYCLKACPFYEQLGWESASPRGKMFLAKSLIQGKTKLTRELVERFYQCSTCGACRTVCQSMIDTVEVWELIRRQIVNLGKTQGIAKIHQLHLKALKKHNPYGEPPEKRAAWLDGRKSSEQPEIAFFVGCTGAYRRNEIPQAVARILDNLGYEWATLGPEEYCCWSPLLRTGQIEGAKAAIHHNVEKIERLGVEKVVYSCSGCYRTSLLNWPKYYGRSLPFQPLHTTQLLAQDINSGKLKFKKKLKKRVTYHDPCHLGRHIGLFEEPRYILESIPGLKLVEMERNRENSRCCGAGGGMKSLYDPTATSIAIDRLGEAVDTGAEVLVTPCVFCKLNFLDGIKQIGKKIDVLTIEELVADLL